MFSPTTIGPIATLRAAEMRREANHERSGQRALVHKQPGANSMQEAVMTFCASLWSIIQLAVITLLLDRRAQAAVAVALALAAVLLLGAEGVEARPVIIGGVRR